MSRRVLVQAALLAQPEPQPKHRLRRRFLGVVSCRCQHFLALASTAVHLPRRRVHRRLTPFLSSRAQLGEAENSSHRVLIGEELASQSSSSYSLFSSTARRPLRSYRVTPSEPSSHAFAAELARQSRLIATHFGRTAPDAASPAATGPHAPVA
jgi:hypothetical protein